jgi:hypothetical protein
VEPYWLAGGDRRAGRRCGGRRRYVVVDGKRGKSPLKFIGPNVHPAAIISDCEGGLFAPIVELFPESKHLLCTWHINNCVKVKAYNLFNKNLEMAERLVNGKWRKILQATTEEAYERELANFRDSYQWCPALVDYVMQQWVPHREKFVKYWTN